MTDITDKDRRAAREWAASVEPEMDRLSDSARAVARVILATVDSPEPTLADEIRGLPDFTMSGENCINDCHERADTLASRADQMEHDLAEARAEVGRLTVQAATAEQDRKLAWRAMDKACGEKGDAIRERDEARAEVERLTAEHVTDPSPTLNDGSMTPDPADVKPGEAWLVSCGGGEPRHGFRRGDGQRLPWVMSNDDTVAYTSDNNIRLVSRLVPAPRQITTRGELNALPRRTVIRDKDGVVCERTSLGEGWYSPESTTDQTHYITFPATVLYTPEVAS